MFPEAHQIIRAALIGLGATVVIDLWALLLKRSFNTPSLSYCLLGPWILHMPGGTLVHDSISAATPRPYECPTGWSAHYLIGTSFAILFVLLAPRDWLTNPTLMPALAFGVVTTLVPYFVMQPALGLGIAASKAANPTQARFKSLVTHTVFGLGLYLWALLLNRLLGQA
jgi:hypothetical protein